MHWRAGLRLPLALDLRTLAIRDAHISTVIVRCCMRKRPQSTFSARRRLPSRLKGRSTPQPAELGSESRFRQISSVHDEQPLSVSPPLALVAPWRSLPGSCQTNGTDWTGAVGAVRHHGARRPLSRPPPRVPPRPLADLARPLGEGGLVSANNRDCTYCCSAACQAYQWLASGLRRAEGQGRRRAARPRGQAMAGCAAGPG